ncbi:MAG TPA: regulatory protein RecX [Chakrabartia sp.]|jgi:regulatory protein|nr:regulatory protein RecX [Chakrabartia sp.]
MAGRAIPLDKESLRALAIHYVARYATSSGKLSAYLARKLRERGWGEDAPPDIPTLVAACVEKGFVDDSAFARIKSEGLRARGYGGRRVHQALRQAGIGDDLARTTAATSPEEALRDALHLAARKRIGPYSQMVADDRTRHRWVGQLARAGHGADVIRTILAMDRAAAEACENIGYDDG